MLLNYYKILNVSKNASAEELKASYRKLVMFWHPDKNSSSDAHDKIVEINEAYEILRDRSKRMTYDSLYEVMFNTSITNNYSTFSNQNKNQESNKTKTENEPPPNKYKDYENLQNWIKEARINAERIIKEGIKIFEKSLEVSIIVARKGVDVFTTLLGFLFCAAFGFGSLKYIIELIGGTANFSILALLFSIFGLILGFGGIIGMAIIHFKDN